MRIPVEAGKIKQLWGQCAALFSTEMLSDCLWDAGGGPGTTSSGACHLTSWARFVTDLMEMWIQNWGRSLLCITACSVQWVQSKLIFQCSDAKDQTRKVNDQIRAPKQMEGPHPKNVLPAETCQLISEQNVFYLFNDLKSDSRHSDGLKPQKDYK